MSHFWTLWKRQLAAYALNPAIYVTFTVFLLVTGLNFWRLLLQSAHESMSLGSLLFGSGYLWVVVLACATVLIAPLLAEEKQAGTIETLLTTPVTDTEVVLSKYFAALTVFAILCAPTAAYIAIAGLLSAEMSPIDPAVLAGGWFILLLNGVFTLAFGLCMSSLTRSQAAATIATFPIVCLLFFADTFQNVFPDGAWSGLLGAIAGAPHALDFSRGIFDSRPVFLYASGAAFFLFVAIKAIESRHWK